MPKITIDLPVEVEVEGREEEIKSAMADLLGIEDVEAVSVTVEQAEEKPAGETEEELIPEEEPIPAEGGAGLEEEKLKKSLNKFKG